MILFKASKTTQQYYLGRNRGNIFIIMFRTLQLVDALKICLALNFPKLLVTLTHIAHKTWEYVLTIHKK